MEIKIELSGVNKMIESLTDFEKQHLPFATAKALTKTGQEVKAGLVKEMESVFDRPTPYTLDALMLRPATKSNLVAFVWLKDFAGKGTPAVKYLWAQVVGGSRNLKRFESALQRVGALPRNMFITPGEGADLDQYGNMSKGQIVQILSYFQAMGEQGYRANMTDAGRARLKRGSKKKRGFEYFIPEPGSRLRPGIYKRLGFSHGSAIKPVLIFIKAPGYEKRFKFFEVGQRIAAARLPINLNDALSQAIREGIVVGGM